MINPVNNGPIYKYSDIKPTLKTGDIILFSKKEHRTFLDKIIYASRTNLLGTEYGHVGLIIRNKTKVFIMACCNNSYCGHEYSGYLNAFNKGGVRITDLDILLEKYHQDYKGIYAVKHISREIPNNVLCKCISKYKHVIFRDEITVALWAIMDILISHKVAKLFSNMGNDNEMICSDFLYTILHDCGVVHDYPSRLFWPHLLTNGVFENLTIIRYSKPYVFTV